MARPHIEGETLSFYPPRARWWSRLVSPWFRIQRALHLEQIHCPRGFSVGRTFLSLFVPGLAFVALGRRMLGLSVLAVYCLGLPVFIIRLGFPEGNIGYGLSLAAHATSVFYFLSHCLDEMKFFNKLLLAAGSLFVVWFMLYSPIVNFFEGHYAVPLRVRGEVVVMHPDLAPAELKCGDHIMFNFDENEIGWAHGDRAVYVNSGVGWGPVLGLPGDEIVFATNRFAVNGVWQASLPHMPANGEFLLPTNRWFIWPEFGINSHNVSEENISALILRFSMVSATQMSGRAFETWCGRKQKIP